MIRGAFILTAMYIVGMATGEAIAPMPFPLSLVIGAAAGAASGWLCYDLYCREVVRWFAAGVAAGRGVSEIHDSMDVS